MGWVPRVAGGVFVWAGAFAVYTGAAVSASLAVAVICAGVGGILASEEP